MEKEELRSATEDLLLEIWEPVKEELKQAAIELAKDAARSAAEHAVELIGIAAEAAGDALKSAMTGRMTVNEWANTIITAVDRVKEHIVNEAGLRFVGGKLRFCMAGASAVAVSYQLYFLDQSEKWRLAEAKKNVPASKFALEDLDEMKSRGEIVYEVE